MVLFEPSLRHCWSDECTSWEPSSQQLLPYCYINLLCTFASANWFELVNHFGKLQQIHLQSAMVALMQVKECDKAYLDVESQGKNSTDIMRAASRQLLPAATVLPICYLPLPLFLVWVVYQDIYWYSKLLRVFMTKSGTKQRCQSRERRYRWTRLASWASTRANIDEEDVQEERDTSNSLRY